MEFVKLIFMAVMMISALGIANHLSTLKDAIENHNSKIYDQNQLLKKIAKSLEEISKK